MRPARFDRPGPGINLPLSHLLWLACVFLASHALADEFWPAPRIPEDNPWSAAKAELGERLFSETRLSITGSYSCASCHDPERHFTDGRALAVGATGARHTRNTPTLYNAGYAASLGWDTDGATRLEAQHLIPLHNEQPIEMGYRTAHLDALITDPSYRTQFAQAFPGERPTTTTLIRALASYVRSLRHPANAFDRYLLWDERDAMSAQAKRGMTLFFSDRLGCARCHAGFTLSGPIAHEHAIEPPEFRLTGVAGSTQRFRAPTLRAVRHTAPYMHAGQIPTLDAVVRHYESTASEEVPDFALTAAERAELVAFLESL